MSSLSTWALEHPELILEILVGVGGGVYVLTLAFIKMWLKVHRAEADKAYQPSMTDEEFRNKTRSHMEGQYVNRVEYHALNNAMTELNLRVAKVSDQLEGLAPLLERMTDENRRQNEFLHTIDRNVAGLFARWEVAWEAQYGAKPRIVASEIPTSVVRS